MRILTWSAAMLAAAALAALTARLIRRLGQDAEREAELDVWADSESS